MPPDTYLTQLVADLTFPPSLNTYYRTFRNRTVISADGRAWREQVIEQIREQCDGCTFRAGARLSLQVILHAPDRRRRDLDNFCGKALQDALQHAGLFEDDSQIDQVMYMRGQIDREAPRVRVTVQDVVESELGGEDAEDAQIGGLRDGAGFFGGLDAVFVSMGCLAEILLERLPTTLSGFLEASDIDMEGDPDFPVHEFLAFMKLNREFEDRIYDADENPLGLGLDSVRILHERWREMHNIRLN